MQSPSINIAQPKFGFISQARKIEMLQKQHGVSLPVAIQWVQQGDAFAKRYLGSAIPYSLVGAVLGFVANRLLPKSKVNGLWVFGGWILGNIAAGIQHWPEAKKLYASMREKSSRSFPAYVDKLYDYKQNL
jgi:predicted anti-sigma-YlaC factor YlaD